MWRRWNNNPNAYRAPSIGYPTLIETTVEEGYLETIPEVDSLKSKRSSVSTILPELPFRAMPPMHGGFQQHREPVWSQPSPTIPDYYPPQPEEPSYHDRKPDVSPISSPPRSNPDTSIEETPISPIESELPFSREPSLKVPQSKSRIPRRAVPIRPQQDEPKAQEVQETKWDAYSGEPTKEESGLASTVRPGSQLLESQFPNLKERTKQILAGIREREAANKPAWGVQPPPVAPPDPLNYAVHKEPWKGPSGRQALIDPIQNDPSARTGPIHHPPNDASHVEEIDVIERAESPAQTLRSVASEESIKPIAPLRIATKSRNPSPQSSNGSPSPTYYETIQSAPPVYQHSKSLQSPFSSPGPVRNVDFPAPLICARTDTPPNDLVPDTPPTPTPPPMAYHYETTTPIKVQHMPDEPDTSRFSWTTYSTSVTESPSNLTRIVRNDSPPPMPPIPQLHIKKRPVPATQTDSPYSEKPVSPSQGGVIIRKPVAGKNRPSSIGVASQLSLSKTLPQIPPEVEATNKISSLEAQLNALAMRKYNTNRILRDLNETLTKNAIVYDMWKRRDITDRISNHETELQTIANEEHEIGLLLHRAQKKRDREDSYELPTGLWIRRVTS